MLRPFGLVALPADLSESLNAKNFERSRYLVAFGIGYSTAIDLNQNSMPSAEEQHLLGASLPCFSTTT
jgi:hypothetical protein